MPNYQELTAEGTSWKRCYRIIIDNPYGSSPSVRFYEEEVAALGSRVFGQQVGELTIPVIPEKEIELVNPETGEPIGETLTHAQLYVMLHSAYLHSAKERDAANAPQLGPEPIPTENSDEPTIPPV